MLKRGFLVVFEGIDGAGKTTQARLLYEYLKKTRGLDVILSKEPTDSIYGRKIKKLALKERPFVAPEEEYKLFINDRKVHVQNVINPALEAKKIVILDRYYFSTVAYQGALGLNPEKIKKDNESFAPKPERVFLLKVAPRLGIIRIQKGRAEAPNLFEKEESLTKVAEVFDTIRENYVIPIDGSDPVETVHAKVLNVVNDVIDHYLSKEEQYTLFNRTKVV